MTEIECFFGAPGLDAPYCRELLSYDISGGWMLFNGYFHAQNEKLPLQCSMSLTQMEEKPYMIERGVEYYNNVFQELYFIEITKREFLEDTSEYSEEIDEDGTPMKICFFPTHHIKIWFRVIAKDVTKNSLKPTLIIPVEHAESLQE